MKDLKNKTLLMGILNTTPDSFYAKSQVASLEKGLIQAKEFIKDGADIIDIGGESSRPGANAVSETEEINRVIPLIKEMRKIDKEISISIDTVKPKVANLAMENGASLINDISGFSNEEMIDIAKSYNCPICVMHMKNTPKTMQINPNYTKGIVFELINWFKDKANDLITSGFDKNNIILDPEIGFGKTVENNLEILRNITTFQNLGSPLLLGISRKSFLSKTLNKKTEDLLPATLALNSILINSRANIIRVHDIKEHRDAIDILNKLLYSN